MCRPWWKLRMRCGLCRPWWCGAPALGNRCSECPGEQAMPGASPVQESSPIVLWRGPHSFPTATCSHRHFPWGWEVPQVEPPLCPTCSGQLCLCIQQWAGRMWRVMLSHLQNMLVCPPVLLNNEEVWRDIHHIGRCSKCSRVLVRVHIWLVIRGSILERTSGSVMSVVRPSDKPLSQWFVWEPTEGTNPMNVRVWEDLSSLLPSQ